MGFVRSGHEAWCSVCSLRATSGSADHRRCHSYRGTGPIRGLILGVAAADASKSNVLLAGVAGLVAGAMSMAAGEHVSVSSQSDTEMADLAREKCELSEGPEFEKAAA